MLTEWFFLKGMRYSSSKIFSKGTKKHKGSALSMNYSNFPYLALFCELAYRMFVNYDPLSSAKVSPLSTCSDQRFPSGFLPKLSSYHSLPSTLHAPRLSSSLKSSTTLSSFKSIMTNTLKENAFTSALNKKTKLISCL